LRRQKIDCDRVPVLEAVDVPEFVLCEDLNDAGRHAGPDTPEYPALHWRWKFLSVQNAAPRLAIADISWHVDQLALRDDEGWRRPAGVKVAL
jgi:hypothetical protein